MTRTASALVLLALIGIAATAEEKAPAANKVAIDDVKPDKNSLKDDKVDEIITNNQMRAQTGSKSKWSISNSINYNGGTLETPFNERIPNISAGTGNTNVANMTDSISVKYRMNTQSSLLAGFGARWITPLNGSNVPDKYNGNKFDAYNPYTKYQYVYRWSGIQSALSTGPTWTTFTNLTRMGYVGNWIVQQNNVYEVPTTDLSLGMLTFVIYAAYNNKSAPFRDGISDYSFAFEPFIEYKITPRVNVRTFWGLLSYEHIVAEPRALTFFQDVLTQSAGVGIKVMRDLFLYPNVTFIPYDIRADRTNVGLSANINLF